MSYFYSEQAAYRAKRIAQMLAPEARLAAQRDGRVLANFNGTAHLFTLDTNGNLAEIAGARIEEINQTVSVIDIV